MKLWSNHELVLNSKAREPLYLQHFVKCEKNIKVTDIPLAVMRFNWRKADDFQKEDYPLSSTISFSWEWWLGQVSGLPKTHPEVTWVPFSLRQMPLLPYFSHPTSRDQAGKHSCTPNHNTCSSPPAVFPQPAQIEKGSRRIRDCSTQMIWGHLPEITHTSQHRVATVSCNQLTSKVHMTGSTSLPDSSSFLSRRQSMKVKF